MKNWLKENWFKLTIIILLLGFLIFGISIRHIGVVEIEGHGWQINAVHSQKSNQLSDYGLDID